MSRMRRLLRFAIGAIATAGLVLAILLAFATSGRAIRLAGYRITIAGVYEFVRSTDTIRWIALAAFFVTSYGTVQFLRTRARSREADEFVETTPELPEETEKNVPGAEFTERYGRIKEADSVEESVASELREVAIAVNVERSGISRPEAKRLVKRGEWTDDRRAATFLSDAADPPSLFVRVRDWLSSEPTAKRRARHALRAIEAVHVGGETDE